MPVVYLNQRARGAASVSIDDAAAVRAGVRYLANLGHRRIGFARAENRMGFSYSAVERIDGFRAEQAASRGARSPTSWSSPRRTCVTATGCSAGCWPADRAAHRADGRLRRAGR